MGFGEYILREKVELIDWTRMERIILGSHQVDLQLQVEVVQVYKARERAQDSRISSAGAKLEDLEMHESCFDLEKLWFELNTRRPGQRFSRS